MGIDILKITFEDGHTLECRGYVHETSDGQLFANDGGPVTEVGSAVTFFILEGTLSMTGVEQPLQSGMYLINSAGLWHQIHLADLLYA